MLFDVAHAAEDVIARCRRVARSLSSLDTTIICELCLASPP